MMKASELMQVQLTCVGPETQLEFTWELMRSLKVRHMPVVDGEKLLGIVSDRDLMLRATLKAHGQMDFPDLPTGEIMTRDPITAPPTVTVSSLAQKMVNEKIDSVPIVDAHGALVGLVTSTDLLRLLAHSAPAASLPYQWKLEVRGTGNKRHVP